MGEDEDGRDDGVGQDLDVGALALAALGACCGQREARFDVVFYLEGQRVGRLKECRMKRTLVTLVPPR